jgi:hypothetical protein
LFTTPPGFKPERLRHNTNRQRADRLRDSRNNGCAAGTSSATLTRGHKNEVSAREALFDLLSVVFSSVASDLWVSTSAEPPGEFSANVELDVGIAHEKGLRVSVDGDELDSANASLNHAVDSVYSATTDTDDLDYGKVIIAAGSHGNPPTFRLHLKLRLFSPREATTR